MRPRPVACLLVVSLVALSLAACGGGGSSAGSSSTEPKPPAVNPGGPIKKATAPSAPAGSKVTSCGGGAGVSGLRATAIDCGAARATMRRWQGAAACRAEAGASRASCAVGSYRCQAVVAGRGTVVSCAKPGGGDVSFILRKSR